MMRGVKLLEALVSVVGVAACCYLIWSLVG